VLTDDIVFDEFFYIRVDTCPMKWCCHFLHCGRRTRRQWAVGSFSWPRNDAYDAWYVQMQMQKWLFLVIERIS